MIDPTSSLSCDAFTHKVMCRIYTVYFLRRLGKPAVIESALLVICAVIFSTMVSMSHVIANADRVPNNSSMMPLLRFFWAAFLNTDNIVKILCVAMALTGMLFCYSVIFPASKRVAHYSGHRLGQIFYFFKGSQARTIA